MLSIENAKPVVQKVLHHLEEFEKFCMGEKNLTPDMFRDLNKELSISAVLMIGKRRYAKNNDAKHIIWKGLDNQEHDLGRVDDINVMRDYPGFHGARTLALGNDHVQESKIIDNPKGSGSVCQVTMKDGSIGIGPNYRMALRNASLKMHLTKQFNIMSLTNIWNSWGYA